MPKTDTSLKAGDKAPGFSLLDYNGKPMSLESILNHGKALLLFFRGTW
jgi:peroxiredoxin